MLGWEVGEHHCPATEAPALKKMLTNLEIPFALQMIQFVLPLYGINWSCCCFVPIVHVNNAAVRWLSMVKILVTNQAGEIKNTPC